MGVLNVTPDSFSDGGRYADLDAAVAHGLQMRADGADLVDVGGESTRPGRRRGSTPATETARVVPVIRELAAAGVPVSVDTTRAAVAAAALEAGASVVNDVSGGLADPDMAEVVADGGLPLGAHALARALPADAGAGRVPRRGQGGPRRAAPAGGRRARGRGRRRTASSSTRAWASPSGPSTTGVSRPTSTRSSRWASPCWSGRAASPTSARCSPTPTARRGRCEGREAATIATSVLAVLAGAWGVRVHDVLGTVDALKVLRAHAGGPMTGGARIRLDPACRAPGPRPPRRLRLRARRGPGVRRRREPRARPRPRRRPPTTSPTPSTTASWPTGWSRSSPASRSTSSRRSPTGCSTSAWPTRGCAPPP